MRTIAARSLLALACLCLASGGFLHALAYPSASRAIDGVALSPFLSNAFRGLWLSDSGTVLTLACLCGAFAVRPVMGRHALLAVVGMVPIISAAVIYGTMGGFFAGHILLLSGLSMLAAAMIFDRQKDLSGITILERERLTGRL